MKTSRLALGANPCGATHPCASASARPAQPGRRLIHLAAILWLALNGQTAFAASANFAWDENPEPDIVGYRLYHGTSPGIYSTILSTGTATGTTVSGLNQGQTYYFVVTAVNAAGVESTPSAEISYQVPVVVSEPGSLIPHAGWILKSVSSQEPPTYAAALAFDGNPATFWHTEWINSTSPPPHEIAIDLGVVQTIGGFRYLPRQDAYDVGNIGQYEFYVSMDGRNWGSPVATGVFSNTKTEKEVLFASVSGRFVKLREITEVNGKTYCNVAELNIVVGGSVVAPLVPVNQVPVATDQSKSTAEDSPVAITLSAMDADGDQLGFNIVNGPSMGSLSGTAPNLTYTPSANANGKDSFTFVANDGKTDSNTATISITVTPANDAPVAVSQTASTAEDKAAGILLSASDKDGDALGYRIVSGPAKGSLSGTAPNLTYIPNSDFNGTDSFTFVANDGVIDSNTASVSITINQVNDAPVAAAKVISATPGAPVGIVISASDADGDPLTFSIASSPVQGSLSGIPPNLTYTPNANASGSDSFGFHASDGKLSSNTATISINITAAETTNKPPVFQADLITRDGGRSGESYTTASLAGSAVDPDGDAISYAKVSGPEWLLVAPDGKISGTPAAAAAGLNSFVIRASDPKGASDDAVLEITILANELPLPWNLARIGTLPEQATAWDDASVLNIRSPGFLAGAADNGLFTWQTLSGDGEITARISAIENANSSSLIGLEIRESLGTNSKHVFIGTTGTGSLRFIRRGKNGGSTSTSSVGSGMPQNLWLRLSRTGTTVSAFSSVDGSSWTRIGKTTVSPSASSYIGMMVCGGGTNLSTGAFQNVTVLP